MTTLWLISSGNEQLALIKRCNQHPYLHDLSRHIYYDSAQRPYAEKDVTSNFASIKQGIAHLRAAWVSQIILPPLYELILLQNEGDTHTDIIPVYTNYLLNHCFSGSLIGKLWLLTEHDSHDLIESIIQTVASTYPLSDNQHKISSFHQPFALWRRQIPMRQYFTRFYAKREQLINTTIKHDLRYFKDANVDTIIPTSYHHFVYERTITNYHNPKKQKFHKLEKVIHELAILLPASSNKKPAQVTVTHTGSTHMLQENVWLLYDLHQDKTRNLHFSST